MSGDIAELGFAVDSGPLVAANDQLERMPGAATKAVSATQKFNHAVESSGKATERFFGNLERMAEHIGEVIGDNLRQIAIGFGTVFAITEFVNRLKETAESLDQVSKAARATKSSIASMQALAVAGDLAGLGADYVAAATKRMNRVLGTAISQGKAQSGVFKELGISAKTLAALPVDQRFAMIGDRLKELGLDASQSTAILTQLGDRGGQLINLLGDGGDEIRKAAKDVQTFGLAITDLDGRHIEDMNDNFTRLGYSVQGAFNHFIAFIAPTLATIFIGLANGIVFLVQNMDKLTPVLEIIGPMLLVAFAPVVLASIIAIAGAIGTNLVGAFVLLGEVIMANPLLALATLLVGAIAAIWVFRDNIKAAIGVDVQGIFTTVANVIIRVFMTAFATIKDMWNNLPSVIGGAVIDAANWVINGVNDMVDRSIEGLKRLGDWISQIPLFSNNLASQISKAVAGTRIQPLANPFSDQNTKSAIAFQQTLKDIWSTDYVGQITTAWQSMSTPINEATDAASQFGSVAGGANAKAVGDALKAMNDQAAITQKAFSDLKDTLTDMFGTAFRTFLGDLKDGKSLLDSLGDALDNIANKMLDMVANSVITNLISGLFGGGGFGQGLTGAAASGGGGTGVFGIPGLTPGVKFAKGGVVNSPHVFPFASGTGLMGEAGPEAIMPLRRTADGSLGVMTAAYNNQGGASFAGFNVNIYNSNSNDNDVTASQNSNGDFDIYIDKKISGLVNSRKSQTNKAIRQTFGVNNAVKQR